MYFTFKGNLSLAILFLFYCANRCAATAAKSRAFFIADGAEEADAVSGLAELIDNGLGEF